MPSTHPDTAAAPRESAPGVARLPPHRRGAWFDIDTEDVILAAWLGAVAWIADSVAGGPTGWLGEGREAWAIAGIAAAVIFLLVTRGPEDQGLDQAIARRALLVGPAYALLSLYALAGSALRKAWLARAARARAGQLAADLTDTWPGPLVARGWRRTVAAPIALVGDTLFRSDTVRLLPDASALLDPAAALHFLMVAAVFVFAVVGPRVAAGATLSPWPWVSRFALALLAAWTGGTIVQRF